jgi:hypothetical protein
VLVEKSEGVLSLSVPDGRMCLAQQEDFSGHVARGRPAVRGQRARRPGGCEAGDGVRALFQRQTS